MADNFVFPGIVKITSFQVILHVHDENYVDGMHSGTYSFQSLHWVPLKVIWQDKHIHSLEQNSETGGYVSPFPYYQITNACDQGVMNWNSSDQQTQRPIFLPLVHLAVFIMSCL